MTTILRQKKRLHLKVRAVKLGLTLRPTQPYSRRMMLWASHAKSSWWIPKIGTNSSIWWSNRKLFASNSTKKGVNPFRTIWKSRGSHQLTQPTKSYSVSLSNSMVWACTLKRAPASCTSCHTNRCRMGSGASSKHNNSSIESASTKTSDTIHTTSYSSIRLSNIDWLAKSLC